MKTPTNLSELKTNKEIIMIADGTGIAPFLGMMNDDRKEHKKAYLFWGGKTKASYKMYAKQIDKAFYKKNLSGLYLTFSKEENQKKHVQDALKEKEDLITRVLKSNGSVLISGTQEMQDDVLNTLKKISVRKLKTPLNMNLVKTGRY